MIPADATRVELHPSVMALKDRAFYKHKNLGVRDSRQWTGGDWKIGILEMRIALAHCRIQRRPND
jgi:hypothetical protein